MQNKLTPTVIGIDIGACTTKIAAVDKGAVDVITNQANFRETPTIVGYGEGQRKIGQIGSIKLKSNFKNTIISPNRYLGLNANNPMTKQQLSHCPCPSKFENDTLLFKVDANGKQENLTSEQVLASFMTQLSSTIKHNNMDEKLIVFSVPSFYTQIQKKAFLNAAEICGLKNVKLTTQTIAIGLDYGSFKKSEMGDGKNILFVDFGYSKLSASLVKFTQTKMDIVYQKANRNLGCRDIDQQVFQCIAKRFQTKKGLDIKQSKRACLKLLEAIQRQRKILSGINETEINIESLMQDEDLTEPFTRQIMFEEGKQIFQKVKTFLNNVKQEIKKLDIKYDAVELVGGGTRIPKIIQIIQQVFEIVPSRTTNSSQTIARGATLAAVQQSGLFRFHSFAIINKVDYTIKLQWKQSQNQNQQTQYKNSQNIINFNDLIPNEKSIKITTTKPTTMQIKYQIQQNQIQTKIAQINSQAPIQGKNQLNLNFKINQDGFVTLVSIKDNDGNDIKFTYTLNKILSTQQITVFKQKQRQMFIKDFHIIKSYEKKNDLQAFIYKQKQHLGKQDIKKYGNNQDITKIQKYLDQINQQIGSDDTMGIKDYEKKKKDIEEEIKKLENQVKQKKAQIIMYYKDIQKLKAHTTDTMKQISQRFRNSKPVQQVMQSLKQIQDWAQQAIKISKTKQIKQLPIVSKQDMDQQYENIKVLVNQLINPPRVQQQAPKHQHYQQHYDPQDYMYRTHAPYGRTQNQYTPQSQYQRYKQQQLQAQKRYQQQQQQKAQQLKQQQMKQAQQRQAQQKQAQQRRQQQQQGFYDPFGMSRSGYFGNNNNFWNGMGGGFW